MKPLFNFVFVALSSALFAQNLPLGHLELFMEDPDRNNRTVTAELYYPALEEGSIFLADGVFPMIVFGHGFVMPHESYENVRNHYVDEGYLVMFITTEGGLSPSHEDFAKDITFMTDYIVFEGTTNTSSLLFDHFIPKVGLIGHSMGGGAAMLAANMSEHVETVIGLAPAETNPSAIDAAALIEKPSLILSGSEDLVTPPAEHHLPIYESLASDCKIFVDILGGAHCFFANEDQACDLGELLSGGNPTIDRATQQEIMFDYVTAWLDHFLKEDAAGVDQLFLTDQNDQRVLINNNCQLLSSTSGVDQEALQLYPNPVSDILYLKGDIGKERNFSVFDSKGSLLLNGNCWDTIDLSLLNPQLLFLQFDGAGEFYKIIKVNQ